jgi:carbonic anhydrase
LVLVLGHEHCGAIKGAIDDVKLGNITALLTKIKPALLKSQDFTGEKTYFKSMSECSRHLGVKNDKLREALKFDGDFDGLRIERL